MLGPLEHLSVVAVAAGREHALVATSDGMVFSFGGGRAVLGRQGSASEPALVTGALAGQYVRQVAAGEVSMKGMLPVRCVTCMGCCVACDAAS